MNKIIVGKIINTHGIKGELKVQRNNEETFDRQILYYIDDFSQGFKIEESRVAGQLAFIKIKGLDDINQVEKFKTKFIRIEESDLYELSNDEFFIKDLIGLDVYDIDGNLVGKLKEVLDYAANDVYVVKTDKEDRYVPAVKEYIKKVDLIEKKIVINFIEGM